MTGATTFLWRDGHLEPRDDCDVHPATIEAADSWLVDEGRVLALDLHRTRFMTSIPRGRLLEFDPAAFWDAAIAAIPRTGAWFPGSSCAPNWGARSCCSGCARRRSDADR